MITIKEFRLLPENEKAERFKELSDHDRFLWRISCPITPHNVKRSELTPEQRKRTTELRLRLLKEGKITQEQFYEFEKD